MSESRARTAGVPVGVALAGGDSRRLGRDKARIEVPDAGPVETLVERALRRLREALASPADGGETMQVEVVVADRGRGYVAGAPSVADGPGQGPAAGLLGAAAAHPGRPLLALACDLPEVPAPLLAHLVHLAQARAFPLDAVVPAPGGYPEPLCAVWGTRALEVLRNQVEGGRHALHTALESPGLRVLRLQADEILPFGRPERIFLNLNRPEDLARWRSLGRAGRGIPVEEEGEGSSQEG